MTSIQEMADHLNLRRRDLSLSQVSGISLHLWACFIVVEVENHTNILFCFQLVIWQSFEERLQPHLGKSSYA